MASALDEILNESVTITDIDSFLPFRYIAQGNWPVGIGLMLMWFVFLCLALLIFVFILSRLGRGK